MNDKAGVLGQNVERLLCDAGLTRHGCSSLREAHHAGQVDLVLGPYSSSVSLAVADVNEKYRIVWPEELAPNQPRFPTPPWSQRP